MKTIATASKPWRLRLGERGAHASRIGRRLDGSVREHALVDLDHARIELLGLCDVAGEDLRPRLVADLERVAKAARRHQERALAPPFEQRIGRDGRTHLDDPDRPCRDRLARSESEQTADRLDRRVRIGGALGQELHRMQPPARIASDHVGEGAAAVDPEVPRPGRSHFRGCGASCSRLIDLPFLRSRFAASHRMALSSRQHEMRGPAAWKP